MYISTNKYTPLIALQILYVRYVSTAFLDADTDDEELNANRLLGLKIYVLIDNLTICEINSDLKTKVRAKVLDSPRFFSETVLCIIIGVQIFIFNVVQQVPNNPVAVLNKFQGCYRAPPSSQQS